VTDSDVPARLLRLGSVCVASGGGLVESKPPTRRVLWERDPPAGPTLAFNPLYSTRRVDNIDDMSVLSPATGGGTPSSFRTFGARNMWITALVLLLAVATFFSFQVAAQEDMVTPPDTPLARTGGPPPPTPPKHPLPAPRGDPAPGRLPHTPPPPPPPPQSEIDRLRLENERLKQQVELAAAHAPRGEPAGEPPLADSARELLRRVGVALLALAVQGLALAVEGCVAVVGALAAGWRALRAEAAALARGHAAPRLAALGARARGGLGALASADLWGRLAGWGGWRGAPAAAGKAAALAAALAEETVWETTALVGTLLRSHEALRPYASLHVSAGVAVAFLLSPLWARAVFRGAGGKTGGAWAGRGGAPAGHGTPGRGARGGGGKGRRGHKRR